MSRTSVALRRADVGDAPFLAELWSDAVRKADPHDQVADLEQVIKTAATSYEQRLIIAEYDGERAGAVLLKIDQLTALNLEPAVHVLAPRVASDFRRKGIGRLLMETGVGFAEENGISHLATGVAAGARDTNRFMARLSLGAHGTFRTAPVAAVRGRLNALRPDMAAAPAGGRRRTRVVAVRRSMRRSTTV